MWQNWSLFKSDVDNLGGLAIVSNLSGFRLSTLSAWYSGSRIPHIISRDGIAVAMGFPPGRY